MQKKIKIFKLCPCKKCDLWAVDVTMLTGSLQQLRSAALSRVTSPCQLVLCSKERSTVTGDVTMSTGPRNISDNSFTSFVCL